MIDSYTNTALATYRRCPREFELRYVQRLDLAVEDRETLQVGQVWHRAHAAETRGKSPYAEIDRAPSPLWREKLRRLYAAQEFYWQYQPLRVVEAERTFRVELGTRVFEGQIDGIVETDDGRRGVLERKTTGDSVEADSSFWDRLRLDVQVGLYSMALGVLDFILYDVVRKPTINPKRLTKADVARMRSDISRRGAATYYGEYVSAEAAEVAIAEGRESIEMYGARLTADIGNRPEHYFARREVHRAEQDYQNLQADLESTCCAIEAAYEAFAFFHRNPDACNTFGRCAFFGLCSNNVHPNPDEPPPDGFRRREHLHPELHDD